MTARNDDQIIDHVTQPMGRSAKLETMVRRYTWEDLVALGAVVTGTIDPAGFPANVRVVDVTTRIPTLFVAPGVGSATVDAGDVAVVDELADAVSLLAADTAGTHQPGAGAYVPLTYEPAYAPRVTFTSDVNLDTFTAGVVEITWTYHGAAPSPALGRGDDTILQS